MLPALMRSTVEGAAPLKSGQGVFFYPGYLGNANYLARMGHARKKAQGVKLKRLEAQTRVICTFNRIVFAVMGLILGLAVVASALPQKRRLTDLEFKLAQTLEL